MQAREHVSSPVRAAAGLGLVAAMTLVGCRTGAAPARPDPARADAPPAAGPPVVVARMDGVAFELAHGRLKRQAFGEGTASWVLQLSAAPASCDGEFTGLPHLLVIFADPDHQRPKLFALSSEVLSMPMPQGTIALERTGDRARGTLDAAVDDRTFARGAFDVVVCPDEPGS